MRNKIILILSIFFVMGCNTTKKEISKSLLGVVYDYKSNPVNNARLKFIQDENVIELTTDIDGKFLIPELDFGEYSVEVKAERCSTTKISASHYDSQNVLIIRIHSYDDLLLEFKDLIITKDIELAKTLISKIDEIDSEDVYYNYLKSIYLIESADYSGAEELLKKLELKTQGEAFVSLLLADLYEYHMSNKDLAVKYLKKYLNREYTLNESNRLKELLNEEIN